MQFVEIFYITACTIATKSLLINVPEEAALDSWKEASVRGSEV